MDEYRASYTYNDETMTITSSDPVYHRMKKAIREDAPKRLRELERICAGYTGEPRLLDNFLDRFESNNPWEAARNARLREMNFRTPEEVEELERDGIVYVTSESGHKMTDFENVYVYTHVSDRKSVWRSGSTAITKIMEAFGSPEQREPFTPEGRQRIKKRKKEQLERTKHELVQTLEEVLQDPSRIKDVQSRKDRLKVQALLGLDEELKRRMSMLDRLRYGDTAFIEGAPENYLLAADEGGTFFGWFERRKEKLPFELRDIYTTVVSDTVSIPDKERRWMMGVLIAYAAANMRIRREAAIGSFQRDFDFLLKLSDNHPLITKYGKPDLTPIRPLLAQTEITLIEATTIFDAYPYIDQMRLEVNQQRLSQYQQEFDAAVSRMESLFLEGSKWREDSYGASVPMGRLEKSIYAVTLTWKDFKAVRDYLRVRTLAMTTTYGIFRAVSMQDFQHLVDGVVLTQRKLAHMDARFKEEKQRVLNPENAPKLVEKWKYSLYRSDHYDLVENFHTEYGLTLEEAIARITMTNSVWSSGWQQHGKSVQELAKQELYSTKVIQNLTDLIQRVARFIPTEKMADQLAAAREIAEKAKLEYTLINRPDTALPGVGVAYLEPNDVNCITELLSAAEIVHAAVEGIGRARAEALIQKREGVKSAWFYIGTTEEYPRVEMKEYRTVFPEPVAEIPQNRTRVVDLNHLEEHLNAIEKEFIQVDATWTAKARYICSPAAAALLERIGKKKAIVPYFERRGGRADFNPERDFVNIPFVQQVTELYARMEQALPFVPDVVAEGTDLFQQGVLSDSYRVHLSGTTLSDGGRIKREFPAFNWRERRWIAYRPLSKGEIGALTEGIKNYNQTYGAGVRVHIATLSP